MNTIISIFSAPVIARGEIGVLRDVPETGATALLLGLAVIALGAVAKSRKNK